MGYMIAFAWNKECEKELKEKGFEKRTVYMKHTSKKKAEGDSEFFAMSYPPYQFCLTAFWGAGPE